APVISSAAPVVETTLVASPTGLCGLVPYSDFDFDSPDEMDSLESRVTARSPSPSDFPIDPVTAPPETRRRAAILIRPGEAIPLARRLAWRRVSPHSSNHHPSSSSSSSDSLPVHSSSLDAPNQAYSGSSTRNVSPRFESSSGDSLERLLHSSSLSAGPSRKRWRSPVDSVPSSTPIMGSLALTRADLLPPHKRFRDSYSCEASIEEDTEVNPIETEV
ncbi:hypothetical protein Tco_0113517, partial [Tanacetum coccineum]